MFLCTFHDPGLGVILDSDKPHLVGIDEDVYSTGITLYHLKNGDTTIGGNENSDIALKGPCIEDQHCVIQLNKDGQVTLIPSKCNQRIPKNNLRWR